MADRSAGGFLALIFMIQRESSISYSAALGSVVDAGRQ
jgi:hypothetical protein